MILGIGVDVIPLKRIEKLYDKNPKAFLDRLYTTYEQDYAFKHKDYISKLAGRFAAKEAFSKALGTGIRGDVKFLSIEIIHNDQGQPCFNLSPEIHKILEKKCPKGYIPKIDLSISDADPVAMAMVSISLMDETLAL